MLKNILCAASLLSMSLQADIHYPMHPVPSQYQNYPGETASLDQNYIVEGEEDDFYPPPTPGCTTSTYPYESYPGLAYETSLSTVKVITTAIVGVALIALIVVAFRNTPCNHGHCH